MLNHFIKFNFINLLEKLFTVQCVLLELSWSKTKVISALKLNVLITFTNASGFFSVADEFIRIVDKLLWHNHSKSHEFDLPSICKTNFTRTFRIM